MIHKYTCLLHTLLMHVYSTYTHGSKFTNRHLKRISHGRTILMFCIQYKNSSHHRSRLLTHSPVEVSTAAPVRSLTDWCVSKSKLCFAQVCVACRYWITRSANSEVNSLEA